MSDQSYKQPSQYDAYYPIYDDDVELYHDGEYLSLLLFYNWKKDLKKNVVSNMSHSNDHKCKLNYMLALIPLDHVSSTPKNIQSTYRPTEITVQTQATPQHHRESYTPKPDLSYQQPTQIYNTEYDDVLVSQVKDGAFLFDLYCIYLYCIRGDT